MTRFWLSLVWSLMFVLAPVARAADTPPDVLARSVTEEVLQIIRNDKDLRSGDTRKARELIESRIAPHFSFASMTQLALGKNWRLASPDQRKALTAEFRALLVQTYMASVTLYKDQVVEYRPLKLSPSDTDVTVRSLVKKPAGGEPVQIDYGMEKTGSGWKVYNVKVGGISLVESYRGSFNSEIQKNGVDGLIKALRDKNRSLIAHSGKSAG